jgi:hypothetical protein
MHDVLRFREGWTFTRSELMTNSEEKWVASILTKKETNSKALASHAVFVKNQQLMPCQGLCMKVRIVYIYIRVKRFLAVCVYAD